MHHEHHKLRLNNLTAIAAMALFLLMVTAIMPSFVEAQSVGSFSEAPFGGFLISVVPATPACPVEHILVFNFARTSPPFMGLVVSPLSKIYLWGNLVTPGTALLGSRSQSLIPCFLPYPIFPIAKVGTSPF